MPLTNPNKVVTEERLSEFYGQILPYMGGMPDVLANKFSKGDLYSTDEKMIGCWTDGKAVYQKTYIVSSVTSSNKLIDSTMKLSDITLVGFISNGIQMGGNYNGTTFVGSITASCSLRVWNDTNGLYCNLENANITATQARFTVQYTKTTDSPIAIGSESDYDSTEKIVGTWFGEWLYQKTIDCGALPNNGEKLVAHGISGTIHIKSITGFSDKGDSSTRFMSIPYSDKDGYSIRADVPNNNSTNIRIKTTGDLTSMIRTQITLQYIKTS